MSIKQDWLERQIEAIGQGFAALLFGKNRVKKVFERFEEEHQEVKNQKMDEMLLDVLINQHLNEGEFLKAEETLFSFIEKEQTPHMLMTALSFYNQLSDLDDNKLKSSGFSKEKITQRIEKLKQIYNVQNEY